MTDIENQPPLNLNTIVKNQNESANLLENQKFAGSILAVDDVRLNQKLIQLLLEKLGLKVTIASDGQEAFELAIKDNFDLILMDIQMPVMDGYQATKKLRNKGIVTPVVALTASALQGDNDKCFKAGCNEFLIKPIDKFKLMQILSKYLTKTNENINHVSGMENCYTQNAGI